MSVLKSDDFNRADGDVGAAYSFLARIEAAAGFAVVSNEVAAKQGTANSYQWAYRNDQSWPDDQYAEITRNDQIAFPFSGACRLGTGGGGFVNGYQTIDDGVTKEILYRMDDGNFNNIGESAGRIATGSAVKIRAVGSAIEVDDDGSEIISVTDATYASGHAGFFGYWDGGVNRPKGDNWEGGDFESGAAPRPRYVGI